MYVCACVCIAAAQRLTVFEAMNFAVLSTFVGARCIALFRENSRGKNAGNAIERFLRISRNEIVATMSEKSRCSIKVALEWRRLRTVHFKRDVIY